MDLSPASLKAFWGRHGRSIVAALLVLLLVVGGIKVRRYWLRVQDERACQELADVASLPEGSRLEHLERLDRQYAGCASSPLIVYRLGLAQRDAGQLEAAEKTLSRLDREHPGTDLARMASEARRALAMEREARAAVAERVRALDAASKAQRTAAPEPPPAAAADSPKGGSAAPPAQEPAGATPVVPAPANP